MSDYSEKQIELALKSDEENLYATIGYFEAENNLGISLPNKKELIENGKKWFLNNERKLKDSICSNSVLSKKLLDFDAGVSDEITILLLISDIIVSKFAGIPAIYIGALIIKKGINKWCNG